MRITPLTATLVLALTLAACSSKSDDDGDSGPTAPPAPSTAAVEASATANVFSPPSVTIARGGTVTWTFGARNHNVTFAAAPGAPESVGVTTNAQVPRTFGTAGSYAYTCTLHSGMNGTVVVQ